MALVNYMSQILVELIKLANLIITITKAVACARRVSSVLEVESTMPTQPSLQSEAGGDIKEDKDIMVRFSHVGLTYQGAGAESLSDIDFSVRRGETVGIIGGTGSGKPLSYI